MPKIILYHNPKCSKSRQTLNLLLENNIDPEIVFYLDTPPDKNTIKKILTLLKLEACDLIRKKETLYLELQLDNADEATLIQAMAEYPILIERPIVIKGNRAAIGRPPANILEILWAMHLIS